MDFGGENFTFAHVSTPHYAYKLTVDLVAEEQNAEPINDAVVMDTPFVVLCTPDCRGLCPVCGGNLNVEQCDCAAQAEAEWAEATENPFAALKNLKLDE